MRRFVALALLLLALAPSMLGIAMLVRLRSGQMSRRRKRRKVNPPPARKPDRQTARQATVPLAER